jgi:ParB/RepB/Spo0J family partition protein
VAIMGRKKKEENGAQVTPATENQEQEVEVLEQYHNYYFCPEGHIAVESNYELHKPFIECTFCDKNYDHQFYYCVIARTIGEAREIYKRDFLKETPSSSPLQGEGEEITTPSSASPNPPLLKTGGEQVSASTPLSATIHSGYAPGGSEIIQYIGIEQLRESPTNPRRHYDEKGLNDLADSIKAKGVVQNLVVRALMDSTTRDGAQEYEIVAGSRRYRAAKLAQLKALPCVVRSYSDAEVLEIQVIENNQREDVHPLEEGEGYAALLKVEGYTVEAIAGKIGRSDKYVRERLQLAKLHPKVKENYEKGRLWYTHARLFSRLTIEQQEEALRNVWVNGFYGREEKHPISVKELETWIEMNIEKALGSASFPLDDATINKQAGACVSCQFNTATDMQLFPDYATSNKKGVCLKPECFKGKVKTYADRILNQKLKDESLADMLLVSKRSYSNSVKTMKDGTERVVVGWDNFEKVKKGEKGAVPAILVGAQDIEDKGKTIYVKLKNKKDAKPAKNEQRSSSSSTGSGEKKMTPEEKVEFERCEKRGEFVENMHDIMISDAAVLAMKKKIDKSIIAKYLAERIICTRADYEAWAAGMSYVDYNKLPWMKKEGVISARLVKMELNEMLAIAICCETLDNGDYNELANMFKINVEPISEKIEQMADEKFPDPAKQLLVSFSGLKYGLKESDYRAELEYISNELRKMNKKEGTDYKEVNIINPGGNNVCFRKDAKSGLYRFSTWIDTDGTAMGFDKLPEAKFIKLVKGFKQAAGEKKSKEKSKKAKKK